VRSILLEVLEGEKFTGKAVLNVVLADNVFIQALNEKFLKRSHPTDVLAFDLGEEDGSLEGEIYVNLDQAWEQAQDYGVSFENEWQRLIIHGVLHLLGYRDDSSDQRRIMQEREDFYLQRVASKFRN